MDQSPLSSLQTVQDIPTLLHTDDGKQYHEETHKNFAPFGIPVESHLRNEDALEAAKRRLDEGRPYAAALVDYNTQSELTGAELIAELAATHACQNILVISSSGDRGDISRSVQQELLSRGAQGTPVEVFDKVHERKLAAIWVAMRVRFPDESREIRRKDMVEWSGHSLDTGGNVPDSPNMEDDLFSVFREIRLGKRSLEDILREVSAVRANREGDQTAPGVER